jgi:hypothetical protein
MEIDPIPEDVREFLRKHFRDVKDEPPQGDYYVFSMKLQSGELRELKVHRNLFVFSEVVSRYLEQFDFLAQLGRANVEIAEPSRA